MPRPRKSHMRPNEKIMGQILEVMLWKGFVGGKHTSEDNIPKNFPKHLRKEAKHALEELIRKGFVRGKPTFYGKEVSINPAMCKEVKEFIEKYV